METLQTLTVGDVEGFEIRAAMVPDTDSTPDDADCYDESDKAAWRNGEWGYVGIIVSAWRAGVELGEASLWGTEYGILDGRAINPLADDAANSAEWVHGYGPQLIREAISEARETLAKLTAA
jgi:hypothetical protein